MRRIHIALLALLALLAGGGWWLLDRRIATRAVATTGQAPVAQGQPEGPLAEPIARPAAALERIPAASQATPPGPGASGTTGLLRVLVLDEATEQPLAGVVVSVSLADGGNIRSIEPGTSARGEEHQTLKTTADGGVEVELPSGKKAQVHARSEDRFVAGSDEALVPPLAAGETREVVLRLPLPVDLPFWLQLVDETTRLPIVSASIDVVVPGATPTRLVTDSRGLVLHRTRSWQHARLHVHTSGRSEKYVAPEPGHETAEKALVVGVPLAATLEVHVRDPSGAPIRDATVELTTPTHGLSTSATIDSVLLTADRRYSASVDGAGTATLADLPVQVPLAGSLRSPRRWNAPDPIVLSPGETRVVRWVIGGGATLRGTVVDQEGRPATRRTIWLRPAERETTAIFRSYSESPTRSAVTDEQGTFRFEDVAPGPWWVGPAAPDRANKVPPDDIPALARFVEIAEGATEVEVAIRVDRGLFIRGQVLGPDGTSPTHGAVRAHSPVSGLFFLAQVSGGEGAFTLGPLMAGRYLVDASGRSEAPSEPIEVDAGTEGVELHLRRGGQLAGRVVAADGTLVEARVTISQRNPKLPRVSVPSTRSGRFEATGLEPGSFDLVALTSDGRVGAIEGVVVQAGEERDDLTISVGPGGSVRVRHEGPERYANIAMRRRGALFAIDGIERGTSRTLPAPPGTVSVQATWRGKELRKVEKTVEVRAGETVDVVFERGGL